MKYISVILPLPLGSDFSYIVPTEMSHNVQIGMRVVVPFGKKKMYTGIVSVIHTHKPELPYELKEIICLLDAYPIIRHPQMKFWEWIASYYQAHMGEVYQAAIPAGLKLESETQVTINPDFEAEAVLSEREQCILDMLSEGKAMPVDALSKMSDIKNIMPIINKLLDKNAIFINEEVNQKYKPKIEVCVKISASALEEDNLRKIFDELSRAKKQLAMLMKYIELTKCLHTKTPTLLVRKGFLDACNSNLAVLNGMIEKGIFELEYRQIDRIDIKAVKTGEKYELNEYQKKAFNEIEKSFLEKPVVLLHGVTSSGKTEIYIHLISKAISEGKQVLFLVPEIALTTQLTSRLKKVFGNKVGVYHSRFSDAERVEIWNKVLKDKGYDLIIGVRSSVFLPFRKLGLIIVDEEHETSFKQYDPAPRYNARNAAIVLANMHAAKTLLGTATPSIESYYNVETGKYGLVELFTRHEDMLLPNIKVVDTRDAYHKKRMNGHFSDALLDEITKALNNKEQVILFQNRRGYAPYLECKACSLVPKCENCDVSLTVHKIFNTLNCHYCGFSRPIPDVCPACKTPNLSSKGFGTEKIEDEIKKLYPEARVLRMDLDTTRSKKAYEKILSEFEQHKADILIGTQMVTKGLDFSYVSLVGILNADNMLNFPDFRSHERAFQLMAQVSGRAGRKFKQGLVVLQTSTPEHPVIGQVLRNDFAAMYKTQCAERKEFRYPPFFRMIIINIQHKDARIVKQAAFELGQNMRATFGPRVLGPVDPPVSRIMNYFIKQITLKIENEASPAKAKELLTQLILQLQSDDRFKALRVSLDVDPA